MKRIVMTQEGSIEVELSPDEISETQSRREQNIKDQNAEKIIRDQKTQDLESLREVISSKFKVFGFTPEEIDYFLKK